jgi:arylsulfatase A-like enzyme
VITLALASFDAVLMVLLDHPMGLRSLGMATFQLSCSLAAAWMIYALLWLLIGLPSRRFAQLRTVPLSAALAAGMSPPLVLRALNLPDAWRKLFFENPYYVVVVAALSLTAGVVSYLVVSELDPAKRTRRWLGLAVWLVPVLGVEVFVGSWIRMFEISGGLSWRSITFYGLALAVLAGTCAMFLRLDPRRRGPEMLGLLTLVLLLVIPVYPWASQPRVEQYETVFSGSHAIPRVIFITIDTLRRDVLTTYTPESTLSPQIDSLARDGIVFEQAYSAAPWTLPSVASILTGLTPFVHGVSKGRTRIPAGVQTLADYFLDAGYATAAFGGNALLYDQPALRRGFQQYEFNMGSPGDSLGLACWRAVFGRGSRPGEQAAGNVTTLAESWVRANQERDFLLWVHLMDPHAPYAPPPEFYTDPSLAAHAELGYDFDRFKIRSGEVRYSERRQGWVKELYRSEVRFADDRIGRLLATLKDLGLYGDSLIVLTSDHGEEFWDHGGVDHGHSFYNELVAVPLIVNLPASMTPARTRVAVGVSNVAIVPTLLDLCGIESNEGWFSARSLAPLWSPGAEPPDERAAFIAKPVYFGDRESVVYQGWKYIRFLDRPNEELYNTMADPAETMNLAVASPEKKQELRERLLKHREGSQSLARLLGLGGPVDPEERERILRELKSMGYVQ